MESNFNNRDFEQFVKQNADQYRMFPSEKVWKGIHNTLHTRRRWYGIGFILLLLTSGTVTWIMLSPSGKGQQEVGKSSLIAQTDNISVVTDKKSQHPNPLINFAQPNKNNPSFVSNADDQLNNLSSAASEDNLNTVSADIDAVVQHKDAVIAQVIPVSYDKQREVANHQTTIFNTNFTPEPVDNSPEFELNKEKKAIAENKIADKKDIYPLTIESVVNSFKRASRRKKISVQVYFSPTISYRKLSENKAFISAAQSRTNTSGYSYVPLYGVNSVVTHKPDVGLELGATAGYPIGKRLKIIAGLQLNVSKYDIKAVAHPSEVATIALNSGAGSNSVSTMSTYRNFDGNTPDWLHNLYISASAPVGAEFKVAGNTRSYLGIGGTIQPTYILADRAYLISTDYKHYAEVPSLIRKWNISSSFEAFVGYTTGKIKWKIGPQVRYQMRSSFLVKYPFNEHLFDFGLKVGIMLTK